MLGFAETPGDLVRLTDLGREMVAAPPPEKKLLFRKRLLDARTFAARRSATSPRSPTSAHSGEDIRAFLAERLPGLHPGPVPHDRQLGPLRPALPLRPAQDELSLHTGKDEDD